jgi:hypothetical protein
MSLKALLEAGYDVGEGDIQIENVRLIQPQCLRCLPGKRYAFRCKTSLTGDGWVLAKLFIAKNGKDKKADHEVRMSTRLAEKGIPTPNVLEVVHAREAGACLLLFEFLDGAVSLEDDWLAAQDDEARAAVFHRGLEMLLALKARKFYQEDLHLGNFLSLDGRLYAIDLGEMCQRRWFAGSEYSALALLTGLMSQVSPLHWDACIQGTSGLPAYTKLDQTRVLAEAARRWRARVQRIIKKSHRHSTRFRLFKESGMEGVYQPALVDMAALFDTPEESGLVRLKNLDETTVKRLWESQLIWELAGVSPSPVPVAYIQNRTGDYSLFFKKSVSKPFDTVDLDLLETRVGVIRSGDVDGAALLSGLSHPCVVLSEA